MTYSICQNFERLGLHDSRIQSIHRKSNEIAIELSHGYLSNFTENGISEAIMFDNAILTISGIKSENYRSSTRADSTIHDMSKPDSFDIGYSLIATNEITRNPDFITLRIGVLSNEALQGYYAYVEWVIDVVSIKLEWDRYILHKNWLDGSEKL